MAEPRTRILSDLHFRDPRGLLHDLATLDPLLDGAERVILNGDAIDTQIEAHARHRGELERFFAARREEIVFLTGNHDPDLPNAPAELNLADGRVWVTHGDVFFYLIAPWSHHAADFEQRLTAAKARDGLDAEAAARVENRLRLNREASVALPLPDIWKEPASPSPFRKLRLLWHCVFPPGRLLKMLWAWAATPRLAATMARAQRPRAQVVILGHTHYPGVWRVSAPRSGPGAGGPPITVINTGSYTRPFGALMVDLEADLVRVRRVRHDGRCFQPGSLVAEIALRAT